MIAMLSYWLLLDSEGGTVIVFSYIPNHEPTTLWWVVPNRVWAHTDSWLKSIGDKPKPRGMNVRKRLVEKGRGKETRVTGR